MKKSIIISLISATLLVLLIISINYSTFKTIDEKINLSMTQIQSEPMISISKLIGNLIDPEIMIILGLIISFIIWVFYSKKESMFLATSMIISGAITLVIKEIIRVQRPANSLIENSFQSFPSGHTAITIVLLGIISYWIIKRYNSNRTKIMVTILATILTLIVGFSRIYLNAHWFSDILGGALLGVLVLTLTLYFRRTIEKIESKLL